MFVSVFRSGLRAAVFGAAAGFCVAGPASATQLLVPSIGAADSAMGGSTIAAPLSATAAAFSNPAGITELGGTATLGLAVPVGHSRIEGSAPFGAYETSNTFVAYAPDMGFVSRKEYGGLRWGFASYGSLGSTFKSKTAFTNFYSSSAVSNLALLAARPFGDKLSIGASLSAVLGQTRLRYALPEGPSMVPYAHSVRGGGVQAMFGLRYVPLEWMALGLGARTPGMLWASGDDGHSGGKHEDVDLELHLPAQVFLGFLLGPFDGVTIGLSGRWTDASTFQDSEFEFHKSTSTTTPDIPYIADASDEWRFAAGLAWELSELLTLRGSLSWADDIVETSATSPLVYDSREWKIGLGFSIRAGENCFVDFAFGHSPKGTRHFEGSAVNPIEGDYSLSGQIYMLGLRFPFGDEETPEAPPAP